MQIIPLVGKTFTKVEVNEAKDELHFINETEHYKFYHEPNCCEQVLINDICGELADLVNTPILQADEESSGDTPHPDKEYPPDSFTWTFYRFATIKGSVVVRWLGESNGYYSETVDFIQVKPTKARFSDDFTERHPCSW